MPFTHSDVWHIHRVRSTAFTIAHQLGCQPSAFGNVVLCQAISFPYTCTLPCTVCPIRCARLLRNRLSHLLHKRQNFVCHKVLAACLGRPTHHTNHFILLHRCNQSMRPSSIIAASMEFSVASFGYRRRQKSSIFEIISRFPQLPTVNESIKCVCMNLPNMELFQNTEQYWLKYLLFKMCGCCVHRSVFDCTVFYCAKGYETRA